MCFQTDIKAQIPLGSSRHVSTRHYTTCSTCWVRREEHLVRAVRQSRHSQNAWARHVERVESWRGKWNLGLKILLFQQ